MPPAGQPERLCFWFGDPIDSARFTGRHDDTAARRIRDELKQAIQAGTSSRATHATRIPIVISPGAYSGASSNELHHQ